MTDLDQPVRAYLDRVGDAPPDAGWDDVRRRERRRARRGRLVRLAAPVGAFAAAVAALALVAGSSGPSLVEKAQAAEITSTPPAGQVSHVRDAYRESSGHVFISYDSWLAADGSWCRSVLEEPVTRYTLCGSKDGTRSAYFPQSGEILRAPPAQPVERTDDCVKVPSGTRIEKTAGTWAIVYPDGRTIDLPKARSARDAKLAVVAGTCQEADAADASAGAVATAHDLLETFSLQVEREDGTRTLDGTAYPALRTTNGDTVLVDPDNGAAVAWIPSPAAFGKPVVVLRTQETVPESSVRDRLSLTALHPEATVRAVSPAALEQQLAVQYPHG